MSSFRRAISMPVFAVKFAASLLSIKYPITSSTVLPSFEINLINTLQFMTSRFFLISLQVCKNSFSFFSKTALNKLNLILNSLASLYRSSGWIIFLNSNSFENISLFLYPKALSILSETLDISPIKRSFQTTLNIGELASISLCF